VVLPPRHATPPGRAAAGTAARRARALRDRLGRSRVATATPARRRTPARRAPRHVRRRPVGGCRRAGQDLRGACPGHPLSVGCRGRAGRAGRAVAPRRALPRARAAGRLARGPEPGRRRPGRTLAPGGRGTSVSQSPYAALRASGGGGRRQRHPVDHRHAGREPRGRSGEPPATVSDRSRAGRMWRALARRSGWPTRSPA
jgi:hypothetical protein